MADDRDDEAPADQAQADGGRGPSRRIAIPVWAAAVALVAVGLLGGALLATFFRDDDPVAVVADNSSTTRSVEASSVPTTSSTSELASTIATTTTTPSTTTTLPKPRGTLTIVGPSAGTTFGQGFSDGPCATWRLLFENNSNAEIVQVVYAPVSGHYSNLAEYNPETQQYPPDIPAEPPVPAVLDLSLPPYGQQVTNFETCTTTPEPANPNYDFSAVPPERVTFTWVSGHEGTAELVS